MKTVFRLASVMFILVLAFSSVGPSVRVADALESVEIVNVQSPGVVAPGTSICFKVTVKVNDGQLLESRGDMLRNTDGNLFGHWPHIAAVGTVNAGQTYTFQCYGGMTAPNAEGSYESKWRVWRNGSWVGQEAVVRFEVKIGGGGGGGQIPAPMSNADFSKVEVGDIIVARTDSSYSNHLANFVGGYWSHAAIVVEKRNGVPYIAESYASTTRPSWWPNWLPGKAGDDRPGVVKRSLYEAGLYKSAQDVAILRVRNLTIEQRQQAAGYAMAPERADQDAVEPWNGKPYNWNFLDKETENAYYCSQLVWAAYKHIGVDLDTNESVIGLSLRYGHAASLLGMAVLPDDIYHSSRVEIVSQAKIDSGRAFKRMVIYLFSPGDLYVVGPDGKTVGTNPITGAQVNEFPDAFYTGPVAEPEYISFRDIEGNLQLHVAGTDTGAYHLVVEDVIRTDPPDTLTGTTAIGVDAIYNLTYDATGALTVTPQDQIPPTTTLLLEGTKGLNDWFITPVKVILSAVDNAEGVGVRNTEYSLDNGETWMDYKEPFILYDGIYQLQYRSTDHVNNVEDTHQLEIKVDTVPPVVNAWADQSEYTRVQPFVVHYSGYDPEPGSGLATLTGMFNNQPVNDGQTVDLFWLPLGQYTLTATGKDYAGWVTTDSETITLVATIPSLQATVDRLCAEKYITKQGICTSLQQKLKSALSAQQRGQEKTAVNILLAFQNELKAQKGKAIKLEAYDLLMMDSDYVIASLGGKK